MYSMHMHQHTQSKSLISYILVFKTENDCLPSFWFFFLKTRVKYLKCVDCWLSFKNENKTVWVVLQRLTLCRDGTKLSSILSYHFMILVQELEMFLFIPWDFASTLHSMSMRPSGTKWLNTIEWYFAWALEFSDDDFFEVHCSLK